MNTLHTAQQWEARRLLAANLFRQNYKGSEIVHILGVAKSSVSRWKKAWKAGGTQALRTKPHPGPKPRLSSTQKRRLVRLLLRGARRAGYDNDLWTCPRVAQLIRREFGVGYHPGWVWQILRDLGWSCQKPEPRARERDEAAIRRWRESDWPRIKKEHCATS
jgi:transposase